MDGARLQGINLGRSQGGLERYWHRYSASALRLQSGMFGPSRFG
jgi:hypothetical protein